MQTSENDHTVTFTYSYPMGVRSTTDGRGMTTSYEYDAIQRLIGVKDQNSHIIKTYDYHFKP